MINHLSPPYFYENSLFSSHNNNLLDSRDDCFHSPSSFSFQSKEHFKYSLRRLEQKEADNLYERIFELIDFQLPIVSPFDFEKKGIENRAVIQLLETGVSNRWFDKEDLQIIKLIAEQALIRKPSTNYYQILTLTNLIMKKITHESIISLLAQAIRSADIDNIRKLFSLVDTDKIPDLTSLLNIPQLELEGRSLLFQEHVIKDAEIVQWLLNLGFRGDARNMKQATPLHIAAYFGLDSTMEILIKHQIHVLQNSNRESYLLTVEELINCVNDEKTTPLHLAILKSHYSAAQFLLNNGADINAATQNGLTPLHIAAWKEDAEDFLPFLFGFPELNPNLQDSKGATPLFQAIYYDNYKAIKFLLKSEKVDILKYNEHLVSPFLQLKVVKSKHYDELKKLFNLRDPFAKAFARETLSRKFLGHVSETGGSSDLCNGTTVDLSGFLPKLMWAKIAKSNHTLESIDPDLKSLLIETAHVLASSQIGFDIILKRWKEGLPVYLNVGSAGHLMGMLLFRNEMVFLNRWEELEGNSFYVAYQFDTSLLNETILKKMTNYSCATAQSKLHFLQDELPILLNCKKNMFHEKFEKIPVFAQKQNIGNCAWLNTQGLEFPLCVLYKKHELIKRKKQITLHEFEKICDDQKILWENLLSNHQHYALNKVLKKINKYTFFEPDLELISRAFCACFPYSKEDLLPEIIEKWNATEKLFFKLMPKIYKERFKKIKNSQELIINRIQRSKQFLEQLNKETENINPILPSQFHRLSLDQSSPPPLLPSYVYNPHPLYVKTLPPTFGRNLVMNIPPVSQNNPSQLIRRRSIEPFQPNKRPRL